MAVELQAAISNKDETIVKIEVSMTIAEWREFRRLTADQNWKPPLARFHDAIAGMTEKLEIKVSETLDSWGRTT